MKYLPLVVSVCIALAMQFAAVRMATAADTACKCHAIHVRFSVKTQDINTLVNEGQQDVQIRYVIPASYSGDNMFGCLCDGEMICQFYHFYKPGAGTGPNFLYRPPGDPCAFHEDIFEDYNPEENSSNATLDVDHCYDPDQFCT